LESAVQQALELDRDKRQSTLRELAVALVMGAEKVATYQQVVDFAGTLMPFEMAFRTKVVEPASVATSPVEPAIVQQTASACAGSDTDQLSTSAQTGSVAIPHTTATPSPAAVEIEDTSAANASHPSDQLTESTNLRSAASPLSATAAELTNSDNGMAATAGQGAHETNASTDSALSVASGKASPDERANGGNTSTRADSTSPTTTPKTGKAIVAKLEQIDWPDEDAVATAEPSKKSNGKSAVAKQLMSESVQAASNAGEGPINAAETGTTAKGNGVDRAQLVDISPVIELKPEPVAANKPEPIAANKLEPIAANKLGSENAKTTRLDSTKAARRDSARPTTHQSTPAHATVPSTPRASSRPSASKPVQATVPPDKESRADDPAPRKNSGGLQISATTLILGFSTTVLAVILIMILLQQKPGPSTSPVNTVTSQFAVPASVAPQPEPLEAKPASTQSPVASVTIPAGPAKTIHEAQAASNEPRVDRQKRSKASKVGKEDGAPENAKNSKKPGQFVPDEI
ncbi:MAG TPA: hypothetical protein VKP30_07760, partial [Polyangiaceae bacterium]|nr:hypothetical protein [Polyangiaceae bacterium]